LAVFCGAGRLPRDETVAFRDELDVPAHTNCPLAASYVGVQ
jgi:hypothetical protein